MSGVMIRKIRPDDSFERLTEMLHRAYQKLAKSGMKYVATYQDPDVTRRRCEKGECYLAVQESRIIGTVTLKDADKTEGSPWYNRAEVACFGQFGIEPEHQGMGIGSALMNHIEERAREQGVKELACDTAEHATQLIDMYKARGYRFIEYADWEVTNYRSVILSKTLA